MKLLLRMIASGTIVLLFTVCANLFVAISNNFDGYSPLSFYDQLGTAFVLWVIVFFASLFVG